MLMTLIDSDNHDYFDVELCRVGMGFMLLRSEVGLEFSTLDPRPSGPRTLYHGMRGRETGAVVVAPEAMITRVFF